MPPCKDGRSSEVLSPSTTQACFRCSIPVLMSHVLRRVKMAIEMVAVYLLTQMSKWLRFTQISSKAFLIYILSNERGAKFFIWLFPHFGQQGKIFQSVRKAERWQEGLFSVLDIVSLSAEYYPLSTTAPVMAWQKLSYTSPNISIPQGERRCTSFGSMARFTMNAWICAGHMA